MPKAPVPQRPEPRGNRPTILESSDRALRRGPGRSAAHTLSYAEVRDRILPQVVPTSMVDYCLSMGQEVVTVPFLGELFVAFVIDEPDRYFYVTTDAAEVWQAPPLSLLCQALDNLRKITGTVAWKQIGTGDRAMFLCETFDGYDASRILLYRELVDLSSRVAGGLLVGVPNRDFLVAIGDGNGDFVTEVQDLVRQYFDSNRFSISPHLFSLRDGGLIPSGVVPFLPNRRIN